MELLNACQSAQNRAFSIFIFLLVQLFFAIPAYATDVNVIGLTTNKAAPVIDGAKPRTVSVGQTTIARVKLISANTNSAVIEIAGKQKSLVLGQSLSLLSPTETSHITLYADSDGHFYVIARVNDKGSIRFLVDTRATMVTISNDKAKRLNITLPREEETITVVTANGISAAYKVKLDRIQIGNITLTNIDAIIAKGNKLDIGLLGMSFLKSRQFYSVWQELLKFTNSDS
ncbi:MAG: TIGR02281 family clan AA aspartic protease [Nitrosomonadaceae bacterium]